jgi:glycerate 2-kinase
VNDSIRSELLSMLDSLTQEMSARRLLIDDLRQYPAPGLGSLWILAIGKAAEPMVTGVLETMDARIERILMVAPERPKELDDPRLDVLVGEHPVPGDESFAAGRRVLTWAKDARQRGCSVMVLLSGGASSLCEWPVAGHTRQDVEGLHRQLVASGVPIEAMNERRGAVSSIKAGGLAQRFGPALCDVRVLVDVPTGDPRVVGSGPCSSRVYTGPFRPIGGPANLLQEAASKLAKLGWESVQQCPPKTWGMRELIDAMVRTVQSSKVGWVTAGEVRVQVPEEALDHGLGGRAQHLALASVQELDPAKEWVVVTWASDGLDGRGGSGAILTSRDVRRMNRTAAEKALHTFRSGSYLKTLGCRLNSFASETNLTDLYMVLRL